MEVFQRINFGKNLYRDVENKKRAINKWKKPKQVLPRYRELKWTCWKVCEKTWLHRKTTSREVILSCGIIFA